MMRIEIVKRPQHSALFSALSPFIALFLTLIAGAILFSLLGKNPISALYSYFVEPLTEIWSIHELLVKAAPLILIAVGLSVCFLSNNWNIGAEGQLIAGGIAGSILPVMFPAVPGLVRAAPHVVARHGWWHGLCDHPGIAEGAVQYQ